MDAQIPARVRSPIADGILLPGQIAPRPADLRELHDPEFITVWASLRARLALTPAGTPGHPEIKRRYDAARAEYQRRLDGGLPPGRNTGQ